MAFAYLYRMSIFSHFLSLDRVKNHSNVNWKSGVEAKNQNRARQGPSKISLLYSGTNYRQLPSKKCICLGFFPQNRTVSTPPMIEILTNTFQFD